MRSRRLLESCRAFSLLELVLALVILVTSMVTLSRALWGIRDQYSRTDLDLIGRLVAESILEQVHERWSTQDSRYFTLSGGRAAQTAGALTGRWRAPFESMAAPRTRLVTPPGEANPYFDPDNGPLVPREPGGSSADFPWEDLAYEVSIRFDVETVPGSPRAPLDADGDGEPERDLAQVEVLVHLEGLPGEERTLCRLTSILTSRETAPGNTLVRP